MAAKAPRKQLGVARTVVTSPSSRGKKSGGGKLAVGGNPAKIWPAPAWQKGIQAFLSGGEGSSSGESSADSSKAKAPTEQLEVGTSKDMGLSSSGGEGSSAAALSSSLLDDDIAQLNSDDEDD